MSDITIRFPGAADATSASTYKIERTTDNVNWTVLAAAQAATAPYVSARTTLAQNVAYDSATIDLTDAASFGSTGSAYLDNEAFVTWTGKSTNQLTGVTWHSGYGTYLANSAIVQAHESYADTGVTIDLGVALYRITHIDGSGAQSAPAYLPYFAPPRPASARHCVVVVSLATDLGVEARSAIPVTCALTAANQFINASGEHLGQATATTKIQTTNAFGLAFFQCFKNEGRVTKGGGAAQSYTFSADGLSAIVSTIPDQDWVLLEDVVDA